MIEPSIGPLVAKLRRFQDVGDEDVHVLARVASTVRRLGAQEDIVREGETPQSVHVLLSGHTCRYKVLSDGRRQITAVLVPGDACDLHGFLLRRMDHGVLTLTTCTLAEMPREAILEITETHPRLARALWWTTLVDEAILREWVGNIGRRTASQRIAHLFCELLARLKAVGLAEDDSYEFPLTQAELGDATGLSTVHVNRTLQELRGAGLIRLKGRLLTVRDAERLKALAGFDPAYLHLGRGPVDASRAH
jgi:CRP-like cAMP-binding protein